MNLKVKRGAIIAEHIMEGVAHLVKTGGENVIIRRRDVFCAIKAPNRDSYSAIFQGMRSDHPGGAPDVPDKFKGVFQQRRRGEHILTGYGKQVVKKFL